MSDSPAAPSRTNPVSKTDPVPAAAPFDHAKADIILRSSDRRDFRVFKLFLSLASPFFETLFEIPQPADASKDQEVKDGLVVIPVTENSRTLDALLRFCYPCTLADDPKLEVFKDALAILEAARKYSLDVIEKKVRQSIANPSILEAEPLRCFAIAHQGRLRKETLLAAKYTLTQPLIPASFPEINMIAASDLLALLYYHKKCGDAVYALRSDQAWIETHYGSSGACSWLFGQYQNYNNYTANCGCTRSSTSRLFGMQLLWWWDDFLEQAFTTLRDKPCKATAQAAVEKIVQTVKARNCAVCSSKIADGMRDFLELLVRKVDEIVSQVSLELSF